MRFSIFCEPGCPWRYLPLGVFPPRSTVYNIFRAFQRDGAWEAIWEELRAALRERLEHFHYWRRYPEFAR
jgi:transposase